MNHQGSETRLLRLLCQKLQLARDLNKTAASIGRVLERHREFLSAAARDALCTAASGIVLAELGVRDEAYSLVDSVAGGLGVEGGGR
jgi:hypothetical protein